MLKKNKKPNFQSNLDVLCSCHTKFQVHKRKRKTNTKPRSQLSKSGQITHFVTATSNPKKNTYARILKNNIHKTMLKASTSTKITTQSTITISPIRIQSIFTEYNKYNAPYAYRILIISSHQQPDH